MPVSTIVLITSLVLPASLPDMLSDSFDVISGALIVAVAEKCAVFESADAPTFKQSLNKWMATHKVDRESDQYRTALGYWRKEVNSREFPDDACGQLKARVERFD